MFAINDFAIVYSLFFLANTRNKKRYLQETPQNSIRLRTTIAIRSMNRRKNSSAIQRFIVASCTIIAGSFVIHSIWQKRKRYHQPENSASTKMKRIPRIILWTIPRSVSTAFERSIMEIPNGKIFHERFGAAYYFGPEKITSYESDTSKLFENTTFNDVINMFSDVSYENKHSFVFSKEFAYYITHRKGKFGKNNDLEYYKYLLQTKLSYPNFYHTFLIRNPKKQILSLYKVGEKLDNWEFVEDEIGYKELCQIYDECNRLGFKNLTIVDSGDLLSDPKNIMQKYCLSVGLEYNSNMINWANSDLWSIEDVKKHFQMWDHGWHDKVVESKGLIVNNGNDKDKEKKLADIDAQIEKLPQNVQDMVQNTMKMYNKLYQHRLQ